MKYAPNGRDLAAEAKANEWEARRLDIVASIRASYERFSHEDLKILVREEFPPKPTRPLGLRGIMSTVATMLGIKWGDK